MCLCVCNIYTLHTCTISQVANAFLILALVTCIYAILACSFFGDRSDEFFGNFSTSFFSMFQVSGFKVQSSGVRVQGSRMGELLG